MRLVEFSHKATMSWKISKGLLDLFRSGFNASATRKGGRSADLWRPSTNSNVSVSAALRRTICKQMTDPKNDLAQLAGFKTRDWSKILDWKIGRRWSLKGYWSGLADERRRGSLLVWHSSCCPKRLDVRSRRWKKWGKMTIATDR
jgi:hypothetical protein